MLDVSNILVPLLYLLLLPLKLSSRRFCQTFIKVEMLPYTYEARVLYKPPNMLIKMLSCSLIAALYYKLSHYFIWK